LLLHVGLATAVPPRSHDLGALATLLAASVQGTARLAGDCAALTQYGVEIRYPGQSASAADAVAAAEAMRRVRRFARQQLGLV
jgi:hypothetical protein